MTDPFHPLADVLGVRAAFIPRVPGIDVVTDRATALSRLASAHEEFFRVRGFDPARLASAEQIHGDTVAIVGQADCYPGADGLVTSMAGLVLGIYVADCAAVYLVDRRGRAVGLVHSGRAGTEKNITAHTIALLQKEFGVEPPDLVVEVSPCIRPPLYETDFASHIVRQAGEAGVTDIRDTGICTGSNMDLYYSYRMERGQTGRMLALLSLLP